MLVSIVIPCYNSEQSIGEVVDLCMEEFDKMDNYECEMILINDYSKDKTFEAIKRCAAKYPNVKGINLAKNFGQHAAIMAGLHYVNGDLVIGMDDDLQNHPSQIRQFLDKLEEGYDIVFGVFKERKFSWYKNLTGSIMASFRQAKGYSDEQLLAGSAVCDRKGKRIRRGASIYTDPVFPYHP